MIDTHCHIDDEQYQEELDAVVQRQQEAGVESILVPGVNEQNATDVLRICHRYPGYLYPALGLHPEDVRADWEDQLRQIKESAEGEELIAIGEIGLDYHFSVDFKIEQQAAFRAQLHWAAEANLPVMIHARDAAEDTLRIIREINTELQQKGQPALRGVMHCFSGSREIADEYIKMGWVLGIGGVLTFKNCKLPETLVPHDGRSPIPLSSLVLETDAPYMAPVPHRGKPNESRYLTHVVAMLAGIYGVTENQVISATNIAAKALFSIK